MGKTPGGEEREQVRARVVRVNHGVARLDEEGAKPSHLVPIPEREKAAPALQAKDGIQAAFPRARVEGARDPVGRAGEGELDAVPARPQPARRAQHRLGGTGPLPVPRDVEDPHSSPLRSSSQSFAYFMKT